MAWCCTPLVKDHRLRCVRAGEYGDEQTKRFHWDVNKGQGRGGPAEARQVCAAHHCVKAKDARFSVALPVAHACALVSSLDTFHAQGELAKKGQELASGDWVRLSWVHEYVNDNGSRWPERPITRLEKITPDQAQALIASGGPSS